MAGAMHKILSATFHSFHDLQKLYGNAVRVLGIETAHIAGDLHQSRRYRDIAALLKLSVLGFDVSHIERQVRTADFIVMKVERPAASGFVLQELKHERARLQMHASQSRAWIIGKRVEFLALAIEYLAGSHSGYVTIKLKRAFKVFDRESNMEQFRHLFHQASMCQPLSTSCRFPQPAARQAAVSYIMVLSLDSIQ
jgi:hypothetical protein